jgi:hypothetical protein
MEQTSFTRIAGFGAVGFATVIVLAALVLTTAGLPPPGADEAAVVGFFSAGPVAVSASSALVPVALVLVVLFGAGAVRVLRRSEQARAEAWSLVGLAGLLLQSATFALVVAIRVALATVVPEGATESVAALWAVHDGIFIVNGTFLALALLGLSVSGLRAGLIPRWHGALGFVSATLLFVSALTTPLVVGGAGPLALIGLAGWLLWVVWMFTYGVVLIRLRTPVGTSAAVS